LKGTPEYANGLIDTIVHELIHAKIHMDELTDMDDQSFSIYGFRK
jgi:hypothetical protein